MTDDSARPDPAQYDTILREIQRHKWAHTYVLQGSFCACGYNGDQDDHLTLCIMRALAPEPVVPQCGCRVCLNARDETTNFYILCPDCGCKRCPKATNHQHGCTLSNDSGQVGSSYGLPCPLECCTEYNASIARQKARFIAEYPGLGGGA